MGWNHRVIRRVHDGGEVSYGVHEVFYDPDGTAHSWTVDPVAPHGDTPEELACDLARMVACLEEPVLDEPTELAKSETRRSMGRDTRAQDTTTGRPGPGSRLAQPQDW